jgi:hypothetical protein
LRRSVALSDPASWAVSGPQGAERPAGQASRGRSPGVDQRESSFRQDRAEPRAGPQPIASPRWVDMQRNSRGTRLPSARRGRTAAEDFSRPLAGLRSREPSGLFP